MMSEIAQTPRAARTEPNPSKPGHFVCGPDIVHMVRISVRSGHRGPSRTDADIADLSATRTEVAPSATSSDYGPRGHAAHEL